MFLFILLSILIKIKSQFEFKEIEKNFLVDNNNIKKEDNKGNIIKTKLI
jgi:hypothetical protein